MHRVAITMEEEHAHVSIQCSDVYDIIPQNVFWVYVNSTSVGLLIPTLSILNSHCQMYCSKYEYHSTMFCQPAASMNGAHTSATSLRNGLHVAGVYVLMPVVCVALLMVKNRRSDRSLVGGERERGSGDVLGGGGGRMIQTDSLSGWGELK